MTSPRRKLPILAEHSLASVLSARVDLSSSFEQRVRREAVEKRTPLSCRTGCAHCCYYPVHVSALEGLLMYRQLVAKGRWTPSLKAKVQTHAESTRDLPFEVWLLGMIPCPLLDEKTHRCTGYDARPFQCRTTFAMGDPENCHPHRIKSNGMVDRQGITAEFHKHVRQAIKRHGVTMIVMPLSVSLLVGESIANGEFDLDRADLAVIKEYTGIA